MTSRASGHGRVRPSALRRFLARLAAALRGGIVALSAISPFYPPPPPPPPPPIEDRDDDGEEDA